MIYIFISGYALLYYSLVLISECLIKYSYKTTSCKVIKVCNSVSLITSCCAIILNVYVSTLSVWWVSAVLLLVNVLIFWIFMGITRSIERQIRPFRKTLTVGPSYR
jgi:hypothetical protein